MKDPIALRLYKKALANQLAVAVGSSAAEERYSIPSLAEAIKERFRIDFSVEAPQEYFVQWNEFVDAAEKATDREELRTFVAELVRDTRPTTLQQAIAYIPISNFIDTTFDRSFVKALHAARRAPIVHDWDRQMMGDWKQPNFATPNLFFMLPNPSFQTAWWGLLEQTRKNGSSIQVANIQQMLGDKDLLLIDYSPEEADWILNLNALILAGQKIINYTTQEYGKSAFWGRRGVLVVEQPPEEIIRELLPSQKEGYGVLDVLIPRGSVMDIMRDKQYDAFISYFHGDRDFVRKLERDLDLRGIFVWRDENEIQIGDSLSKKIQEGLSRSYSMIVVLSPEAIGRPWFEEELNTAFALRREGTLKILPVLRGPCDIPLFLRDYLYADFSNPDLYELRIADLERAIRHTVALAEEKK